MRGPAALLEVDPHLPLGISNYKYTGAPGPIGILWSQC